MSGDLATGPAGPNLGPNKTLGNTHPPLLDTLTMSQFLSPDLHDITSICARFFVVISAVLHCQDVIVLISDGQSCIWSPPAGQNSAGIWVKVGPWVWDWAAAGMGLAEQVSIQTLHDTAADRSRVTCPMGGAETRDTWWQYHNLYSARNNVACGRDWGFNGVADALMPGPAGWEASQSPKMWLTLNWEKARMSDKLRGEIFFLYFFSFNFYNPYRGTSVE